MAVGRENRRTTGQNFAQNSAFLTLFSLSSSRQNSNFGFAKWVPRAIKHSTMQIITAGFAQTKAKNYYYIESIGWECIRIESATWVRSIETFISIGTSFCVTHSSGNKSVAWMGERREKKNRFYSLKNMFKLRIVCFQWNRRCVSGCNCVYTWLCLLTECVSDTMRWNVMRILPLHSDVWGVCSLHVIPVIDVNRNWSGVLGSMQDVNVFCLLSLHVHECTHECSADSLKMVQFYRIMVMVVYVGFRAILHRRHFGCNLFRYFAPRLLPCAMESFLRHWIGAFLRLQIPQIRETLFSIRSTRSFFFSDGCFSPLSSLVLAPHPVDRVKPCVGWH